VLIAAALAGIVTAMPLWVPAGVLIGGAALMVGQAPDCRTPSTRNLLQSRGADTGPLGQGEP
jgi:hypothetical protein